MSVVVLMRNNWHKPVRGMDQDNDCGIFFSSPIAFLCTTYIPNRRPTLCIWKRHNRLFLKSSRLCSQLLFHFTVLGQFRFADWSAIFFAIVSYAVFHSPPPPQRKVCHDFGKTDASKIEIFYYFFLRARGKVRLIIHENRYPRVQDTISVHATGDWFRDTKLDSFYVPLLQPCAHSVYSAWCTQLCLFYECGLSI